MYLYAKKYFKNNKNTSAAVNQFTDKIKVHLISTIYYRKTKY